MRYRWRVGRGRKRLLLVDDEPRNLRVLEGFLGPLGHEIVKASDGEAALVEFAANRPDLVLLDLKMPGIDGIGVLERIRASSASTEHVPVILVTADTERQQRYRGLEAGADEFLEKPVDGAILIARVKALLRLKEAQDELNARNDALERSQREQRELVHFIVHDLKNPLSTLFASVDFARQVTPSEAVELAEALEDAHEGMNRLRTMIDDLLVVSRLEESAFHIDEESILLGELMSEVMKTYGRLAQERQVELVAASTLEMRVRGDRTLLRRVLENMLDNALRYTPPRGRVSLGARATSDIQIAVRNTGTSIPPSQRERIFDKFARGPGDVEGSGNAGLGLYFCKRAVEALGGEIEVVESPEWPTSFVVHLPLN